MLKNIKLNYFFLLFSTFFTTVWINFYYLSPRNVDFNKYYDYINYFLGADVTIDYGQGSLYYFIVSILFKRNLLYVDERSLEIILSHAIQNTNLIFYLLGLIGLYKLLRLFKFDNDLILISLSLLNFFPQSMYIRAVMKPEIIAFSFFPWVLYFIEKFKINKNIVNLYFASPFLLIILTSKGSLAGMTSLYLLITNFSLLKTISMKKLLILMLIFVSLFALIQYENFVITERTFFEREYDESYENKAKFSNILNFNLRSIITQPFFDSGYQIDKYNIHANSIINITILDSFGDFFNQFYDFNLNYFSKNRKDLFNTEGTKLINEDKQIIYKGPFGEIFDTNLNLIRKTLSTIFSIFFYASLIYLIYKDKKYRKFYLMPFIGIITLYINSLGIPSKNYNPFLGDTYKTFYYSFFISIAFLFLIIKILEKLKNIRILFIIFWIISIFFISGHPKGVNQEFSEYLVTSNQHSIFCNINNVLFFENTFIKTIHPTGNTNNLSTDCKKAKPAFLFRDSINNESEKCIQNNTVNNELSSTTNCRILIIDHLFDRQNHKPPRYPIVSILVLFSSLILVINNIKFKTNLTN